MLHVGQIPQEDFVSNKEGWKSDKSYCDTQYREKVQRREERQNRSCPLSFVAAMRQLSWSNRLFLIPGIQYDRVTSHESHDLPVLSIEVCEKDLYPL